jgi:carbamoyl-phosphate synthase/aspartate carbamoyltransferase/dihydroorotase
MYGVTKKFFNDNIGPRSFPFVSQTLGYNFIATATKLIVGKEVKKVNVLGGTGDKFGIKASRLNFIPMFNVAVTLP